MEVKPVVKRPNYHFEYKYNRKETKEGRGFSIGEIKEAKIDFQRAKKLGIRIDKRRKSVHRENVEAVLKYMEELKGQKEGGKEEKK
ncbi:50S ribosomal protein L13e [Stygiolobus caldivivus]|uniref:Large ribosomal subunit protein eL13 n=1 Tax=Stygiolobus caldivivus TaxID=2824673 RepID=A0A8D5U8F3_9CREN|nr:50S ribosomal protein L13e [Stygiolobus caldivivus]BCU70867.1 50S ribosomal protein L13e [Stygiolobus caldivivus]